MDAISKGFLGVAAVCAVVAGGWCFWDNAWPAIIDMTREVHGSLYWDLEAEPDEDGDGYVEGIILTYDWQGDEPEPIWLGISYVGLPDDPQKGTATLELGFHSVRLPCHVRAENLDLDDVFITGCFRTFRTAWGSPPER